MRQWFRDPVEFMERNRDRHGPIFTVKLGALKRCAFVAEPEAAWKVLSGDPSTFRMGPTNQIFRPVLGEQSLFLLDGEEHRHHRRLLAPSFHPRAVRGYAGLIEEIAARETAGWPVGEPFQLQQPMRRITTESIVRIVIGVCSPERDSEIRRLVPEMLEIAENPLALMPQFQRELGGRTPFGRVMNVTRRIDAILHDEIGLRRLLRADERGSDVLSTLCAPQPHEDCFMTDREIRDEVLTMLIAGHETTANALAWSFERLLRHPLAHDRLLSDLGSGDDSYLDAVVRETLRQRPILPVTARRLTAETAARRVHVPARLDADAVHLPDPPGPRGLPGTGSVPARALPRGSEAELAGLAAVRRRRPSLRRLAPGADDDQVSDQGGAVPSRPRGGSRT